MDYQIVRAQYRISITDLMLRCCDVLELIWNKGFFLY